MIIAFHFLIVIYIENKITDVNNPFKIFMCQFNGFLSPFALESQFAYHCCLCHCILNMVQSFQNKKGVSYLTYHAISLSIGCAAAVLSVFILKDVGVSIMGACAMAEGSIIELIDTPVVIYGTIYSQYSVYVIIKKLKQDKNLSQDLRTFFIMHVVNELLLLISYIPNRICLLVAGLGNTFVRVIGDPYLRRKVIKMFTCKKKTQLPLEDVMNSQLQNQSHLRSSHLSISQIYEEDEKNESDSFVMEKSQENVKSQNKAYKIQDKFSQYNKRKLSKESGSDKPIVNVNQSLINDTNFDQSSQNRGAGRSTYFKKTNGIQTELQSNISNLNYQQQQDLNSPTLKQQNRPTYAYFSEEHFINNLKNLYGSISYHFSMRKDKAGLFVKHHDLQKLVIYITINKRSREAFMHFQHLLNQNQSQQDNQQKFKHSPRTQNYANQKSMLTPISAQLDKIRRQEFRFEEYRYKDFKKIRKIAGIFETDIIESFNSIQNEDIFQLELNKMQSGRSGKQIISTFNKRFIVKEIDSNEKNYLINISNDYKNHLQENQKSLMAKIYGLFSLKIENQSKVYFIIMQNLDIYPEHSVIFKYDLKFSEYNRQHLDEQIADKYRHYLMKSDDAYNDLFKQNTIIESQPQIQEEEQKEIVLTNSQNLPTQKQNKGFFSRKQSKQMITNQTSFNANSIRGPKQSQADSQNFQQDFFEMPTPVPIQQSHENSNAKLSQQFSFQTSQFAGQERRQPTDSNLEIMKKERQMFKQLKLLKDLDFKNFHNQLEIDRSSYDNYERFIEQVHKDTLFLSKQFIMDYSLLMMIVKLDSVDNMRQFKRTFDQVYVFQTKNEQFAIVMGIIDYLQVYDFSKTIQQKAQRFWSVIKSTKRKEISCVQPEAYFSRFNNGIIRIFKQAHLDEEGTNTQTTNSYYQE
eukprot:403358396